MKKLILSLVFLSAFTLRGSAQLQGLEVVKVPEAQQPYSGEYIYIGGVSKLSEDFLLGADYADFTDSFYRFRAISRNSYLMS